ncbi:putative 4-hydroxyacetophenone monooxygenase domain protein [Mycobacterium avium MAV_120709_2344]|nr:putative 4-hydroxyacetophenone monooxygenase domain protein [Mycobacterium avium MAV_120709_2344]
MRSRYAGEPFTTSTAEIAAALEDVSIPTLLLSLVHITGDPRFIRDFKQMGIFLNEVQGFMSEEDKARARAEALSVITYYRDRGCPEPEPLSPELIREMMDWAACEHVPDDYLPLICEELDLDGVDPRRPAALPAERAAGLPVLVVGCGESGILAGVRLKQANIPFTIVEKNAGPGGTWWENSYPAPGWTWPTISIATASNPTTTGPISSPSNTSCRTTSPRSSTNTTWPARCAGGPRCSRPNGTTATAPGRCRCARPTATPKQCGRGRSSPRWDS